MKSRGHVLAVLFLLSGCSARPPGDRGDLGDADGDATLEVSDAASPDCGAPRALALAPGAFRATFACRTDTAQPSEVCSDGLASLGVATYEEVYAFELRDPARVSFLVERDEEVPQEGLGRPRLALYLRGEAADPANEIACYPGDKPGGRSFVMVDLLPGHYTLFVESYAQEGDAAAHFRLHTEVDCGPERRFSVESGRCEAEPPNPCTGEHQHRRVPGAAPRDGCQCDPGAIADPADPRRCRPDPAAAGETAADPILLAGTSGRFVVRFDTAADDEMPVCGSLAQGDRVFALHVARRGRLHLRADAAGGAAAQGLVGAVRRGSSSPAAEIACGALPLAEDLDPGLYVLVVEPSPYQLPTEPLALEYRFDVDPCLDVACPEHAACVRGAAGAECLCAEGMNLVSGQCAPDPCAQAPCTEEGRTRCVAGPGGEHRCECARGLRDEGDGCVADPAARPWTVLVYLAHDDPTLDGANFLERDLRGACNAVGCSAGVQLVVFEDTLHKDGGRSGVSVSSGASLSLAEAWSERNSADFRTFAEFARWAVARFPARRYLLLVEGHGAGWRRIASDSTDGGAMSLPGGDYARALGSLREAIGRPIDVVALSSCYMGMWETAQATAPYADYLVASEPFMGGVGIEHLLAGLLAAPDQSAAAVARTWMEWPDDWNGGVSLRAFAVIALREIGALSEAISGLATALAADPAQLADLAGLRERAHRWRNGEYVDLGELAAGVVDLDGAPASWDLSARAVTAALARAVPFRFADSLYASVGGLSIYLPARGRAASGEYRKGAWARDTAWDELLEVFNGYRDVRETEVHRFTR